MGRFELFLFCCGLWLASCGFSHGGPLLDKGTKMSSLATKLICWYEYEGRIVDLSETPAKDPGNCQMNLDFEVIQQQLVAQGAGEKLQLSTLGQYMPGLVSQWLPTGSGYSQCDSFLKQANKPAPVDMSRVLQDGPESYPLKGWAHCVLGKVKEAYGQDAISAIEKKIKCDAGVSDCSGGSLDTGVQMSNLAAHLACWYEYAKKLPAYPDTREQSFGDCQGMLNMDFYWKQFVAQGVGELGQKKALGSTMSPFVRKYLPAGTGYSDCIPFLNNPNAVPSTNMSSVLKDPEDPYPFKGFAHCIVGKVNERYGEVAYAAMKQRVEYTDDNAPVSEIMLGRDNEYRARHGAAPLQLDPELTARAQRWADKLARECTGMHHIGSANPDAFYKGGQMGENIAKTGRMDEADIALVSSNAWYSEVKDYPFATNGRGNDFDKTGHFTAQVWKSSRRAGYAIGKQEGCEDVYTVGRYWPAGNLPSAVSANVGQVNSG